MPDTDLQRRILLAIHAGKMTKREFLDHLLSHSTFDYRNPGLVARALQRMRKAGHILYHRGAWFETAYCYAVGHPRRIGDFGCSDPTCIHARADVWQS